MILNPADKLILALDGMDKSEVFKLINKLQDLRWAKVGLELFVSAGPEVIYTLREKGIKVFLDLKFHDIPNTMSRACLQAGRTGSDLISVHACAGIKALKDANSAAAQGAAEIGCPAPTLLAVTVLTSWDQKRFSDELGFNQTIEKRVELLANLALKAGIGGCVCSPLELKTVKRLFSKTFELITPGIRPGNLALDDQSRVMSPSNALKAGATRLVVGRPITKSSDPIGAFQRICRELENP